MKLKYTKQEEIEFNNFPLRFAVFQDLNGERFNLLALFNGLIPAQEYRDKLNQKLTGKYTAKLEEVVLE